MTDTTDIAALTRPVRDRYDWSNAVWRDCDHCGKQHTGTVTAEDGSQICSHCADQIYWSAWQVLAEQALDLLEAERQRADKAELELIKPLPIGELIQRLEGQTYEKWFSQSDLKGDQVPVGEIVAWAGTNREMGITREVDFRFLRFDVKPGTKLYAIEPAPAVKSDLLTRAQALAVETRALASRIQAGE